jgi:hypothetical protein
LINWGFLQPRNILLIAAIVLITRIAFNKAVGALDGRALSTDE